MRIGMAYNLPFGLRFAMVNIGRRESAINRVIDGSTYPI
jgi:hypothetical protein